jgi:hypothetical protein
MTSYLTLAEAAVLANLSEQEFAARAPALGILPLAWLGAILYRRADIEASMDQAWQENISAVRRGTSPGSKASGKSANALAQLPRPKPRRPGSHGNKPGATSPSPAHNS